jgi:carbonic anhydrase
MKRLASVALLALSACAPCPAAQAPAEHPAPAHAASAPTTAAAVDVLAGFLRDNARFVAETPPEHFAPILDEQHPLVTAVACSDSRVTSRVVAHDVQEGRGFVIRNIGNQVDSAGGSVEYGVRHLHTPLLAIIGHVRCGAVKAALGDYEEEDPPIRRELDGLSLALRRIPASTPPEARWLEGVKANVHEQVRLAMHEYKDLVAKGELVVVGAVYDFAGDMGGPRGKVWVIDVNGETDPARVEALPLVKEARARAATPAEPPSPSPPAPHP